MHNPPLAVHHNHEELDLLSPHRYFTGIQNIHLLPNNCGYTKVSCCSSRTWNRGDQPNT